MDAFLQQGANFVSGKLSGGRDVVYVRGVDSIPIKALIGKTIFRVDNGYSLYERYESRDFITLASGLVLASVQLEPQAGDKIRETVGAIVFIYEAMAPSGEACWRYSDSFRRIMRIHTKLVSTEAV
jgi:hypothetical protein